MLRTAQGELAENDPPAFLAMLLALAAGLRRGEIDSLAWHQIDFERALIRVEATESASLKTSDSRAEVPIDVGVVEVLRGFRAKASGSFVIEAEGGVYGPRVWGHHYRAEAVFTRLSHWLRKHGVSARKPIHELRKELGALVTAEHGIYAASRVLRHSNVATTAAHYTDLKTRPSVAIGSWLTPANVIAMPPQSLPRPSQEAGSPERRPTGSSSFNCAVNAKPNPISLERQRCLYPLPKTKARGGHSGAKQCALTHGAALFALGAKSLRRK